VYTYAIQANKTIHTYSTAVSYTFIHTCTMYVHIHTGISFGSLYMYILTRQGWFHKYVPIMYFMYIQFFILYVYSTYNMNCL
jgi:hypothetical protein